MVSALKRHPITPAIIEHAAKRIGSTADETAVIKVLRQELGEDIQPAGPTDMGDVYAVGEYVINIKTTSGESADNAFSAGGCLLSFTDIPLDRIKKSYKPSVFLPLLANHKEELNRDYWFLVIDKNDPTHVVIRGLREVKFVSSNPTNILQIHWGKELARAESDISPDYESAWKRVIINTVAVSYKKKWTDLNNGLVNGGFM